MTLMPWTVTPEPHNSPAAAALWRAYYTEVSDRYYLLHESHRTDPAELEREIAARTGAELTPPTGRLLDARRDLGEARALYARLGYEETAPHNDEPYADHWFGKAL